MQALFGTQTAATINLIAQFIIIVGLWVGFYFARTKQIPRHRNTQTLMVMATFFFFIVVMAGSFYNYIIEGGTTTGTVATLMMVHGGLGLIALLSGIYLVLRMRTQLIPQVLRVRNFKLMMRSTLALWTILVLLGVPVYYYRFLSPRAANADIQIEAFKQAGQDLVTHALEMEEALGRQNLSTAKRHAEHVVNLIEGNRGHNYGDVDGDGIVEDPGDGTGMLNYLTRFGGGSDELKQKAKDLEGSLRDIDQGALIMAAAPDVATAQGRIGGLVEAVRKANTEGVVAIEDEARNIGLIAVFTRAEVGGPSTVTIIIDKFQFFPRSVTVNRGDTVMWVQKEAPRHTVTEDDGAFNSGSMGKDDVFSFTFDQSGTFQYYCRFHGDEGDVGMAGTIIVK